MYDEILAKEIKKQVTKKVKLELESIDVIDSMNETIVHILSNVIEDIFNEKFDSFHEFIRKAIKEEVVIWMEGNLYDESVDEILKFAILEKFKEFSFEDIKKILAERKMI